MGRFLRKGFYPRQYNGRPDPRNLHRLSVTYGCSFPSYNLAYELFERHCKMPVEFVEEAHGLLDGALAAGMYPYVPFPGRNVDAKDIAVVGALADLRSFRLFVADRVGPAHGR